MLLLGYCCQTECALPTQRNIHCSRLHLNRTSCSSIHISLLLLLFVQRSLCNATNNVHCLLEQINTFSALYHFTFDTLTFLPHSILGCSICYHCIALCCTLCVCVQCALKLIRSHRENEITDYLPNQHTLISQFI